MGRTTRGGQSWATSGARLEMLLATCIAYSRFPHGSTKGVGLARYARETAAGEARFPCGFCVRFWRHRYARRDGTGRDGLYALSMQNHH